MAVAVPDSALRAKALVSNPVRTKATSAASRQSRRPTAVQNLSAHDHRECRGGPACGIVGFGARGCCCTDAPL